MPHVPGVAIGSMTGHTMRGWLGGTRQSFPPTPPVRFGSARSPRSVADRLAEWAEFNEATSRLKAEGVRRRHPDYSDDMVMRALVRRYGDALAQAAWPDLELVDP